MFIKNQLPKSWIPYLSSELNQAYLNNLESFLTNEAKQKKIIFPKEDEVLRALKLTPLKKVKVVIIGQDPYHGDGQAHGLSFSVKKDIRIPPSLKNIYKELQSDLNIAPPAHGNLESWAKQGVLLLNQVLTVEKGKAASHQKKGWEQFTDKIVEVLNEQCENIVFILWGSPAQKKGKKIDPKKHCILKSVHPSPLSAYRGFFGSRPFSKTNKYLIKCQREPIDWSIS